MKGQKTLFSSASEEWATPQYLFDRLHACFNFTVDAAASKDNAKCKKFWSKENSAFKHSWDNQRIFCNPPYGRGIDRFLDMAACQDNGLSVFLLPARTDTKWFHGYIKNMDRVYVDLLKGRLKFGGSKNSAPFPSMIVTFLNY